VGLEGHGEAEVVDFLGLERKRERERQRERESKIDRKWRDLGEKKLEMVIVCHDWRLMVWNWWEAGRRC
jgi:hypothetical protein